MSRQRKELETAGKRILGEMRTELFLSLRAMGPALDALGYELDLRTPSLGTDAEVIRFHPGYVTQMFLHHPRKLLRAYMHILLHCLFLHPFTRRQAEDAELFDLCADIAVEAAMEQTHIPALWEVPSEYRENRLEALSGQVPALTAEALYRHFSEAGLEPAERLELAEEFRRDDHQFWPQEDPGQNPEQPPAFQLQQRRDEWEDRAKETRELMEAGGNEAADDRGGLAWLLSLQADKQTDYREFLRRFAAVREEVRIDPDSFDYGYYHYGLELFGNMPLIEENEYREAVGIDQLVIAIDTSASTRPILVQRFLNETAAMLAAQETWFHRVEVHLLECDDRVQRDLKLTDVRELERYAAQFEAHGGMGTDFRPVFAYVKELQRRGELAHLRGLLYFTDGFGRYPSEPASYDTAFVFCRDVPYDDRQVPPWAMRLYAG